MKYKLLEKNYGTKIYPLYRIVALKDFSDVKKGDIGGYVSSENSLSQENDCWVYDEAIVIDGSRVSGNAKVYGKAVLQANTFVRENAKVSGNAYISNSDIRGNAIVCDDADVSGNAKISGNSSICGNVIIQGNVEILGDVVIKNNAYIVGDARIESEKDYIVIENWWDGGGYMTWTRSNNMWKSSHFYGTSKEFIEEFSKYEESYAREFAKIAKKIEDSINEEKKLTRGEQIAIASCAYGSRGSSLDFEAGAKWADSHQDLSLLWHDGNETPKNKKDIMLCYSSVYEAWLIGSLTFFEMKYDKSWLELVGKIGLTKWAYINNLIPNDIKFKMSL